MLDLSLIAILGFLGSFGHCVGMCAPLAVAFSTSHMQSTPDRVNITTWQQQLKLHTLLNLGRLLSYTLVGAVIGALNSILVTSGQLAGVGSELRHWIAIITGITLIWFGLTQVRPGLIPHIPLWHSLWLSNLHQGLHKQMVKLSLMRRWWTPILLGITWGLMPCGFLYAAQIKAVATGNWFYGAASMLAFGVGTLPTMLATSMSTFLISQDRRSQLFRLGGWITIIIGVITLFRSGDTMVDYSGHGALVCLVLSLIARPISHLWASPLRYRRFFGVSAFILSAVHTMHMMEHSLQWNLAAFWFLPLEIQWGIGNGAIALLLITPAACTSFDLCQAALGKYWRQIHLLSIPALLFCTIHTVMIGSHYLGALEQSWANKLASVIVIIVAITVLAARWQRK
jgi:sulfite exporter TauE/SafE